MRTLLLASMMIGGCVPEYDSVDEGCEGGLPGAETLGQTSPELLERLNCYRRFVGVAGFGVDALVQAAAENHTSYMVQNAVLGTEEEPASLRDRRDVLNEVRGAPGFTGDDPFERNVVTGAIASENNLSPGMVWGWFVADAEMSGDALIANPYVRDMMFQPTVTGVGMASAAMAGETRAYLDVVSRIPSGLRVLRPIVFPKNGQTGVPTGWIDTRPLGGEVGKLTAQGYPVTVTISGQEANTDDYNPFAIDVVTASLSDEDGTDVPVVQDVPDVGRTTALRTTVVLVPVEPLKPETTYTLFMEIDTTSLSYIVESNFTTGVDFTIE